MTFATWSPALVATGLVVLAAALFALQRLRIRFSERRVPTLLFWKEAVRETRARSLVRRFRHPWAYLFLLLLASCLWLAASRPHFGRGESSGALIILVDDSSSVVAPGPRRRVATLLENVLGDAGGRPTRVLACGARPRVLLTYGEPAALALERWKRLRPVSAPNLIARTVDRILDEEGPAPSLDMIVIGPTPLPAALARTLPSGVRLRRVWTGDPVSPFTLASLGWSRAASGRADAADVAFEIRGEGDAPAPLVRVDDRLVPPDALAVARRPGGWLFEIEDLPVAGQTVAVSVTGPDGRLEGRLRLPDSFRIPIHRENDLPGALAAYLDMDPDFESAPEGLRVGRAREAAFRVVDPETPGPAILVTYGRDDRFEDVRALFERLGWDEVWRQGDGGRRELGELTIRPGPRRTVTVSADLFQGPWHFTETEAFPLFMNAALHWLAGRTLPPAIAGVGEPVGDKGKTLTAPDGGVIDGVGLRPVPLGAGRHTLPDGTPVEVAETLPAENLLPTTGESDRGGSRPDHETDPVLWLGAAAFLLLLVEWWFTAKGRMP